MKSRWFDKDSAVIAWVVLAVGIFLYVFSYDYWAYKTKHLMMTTQFRNWLHEEVAGPIVMGIWGGTFIGLTWHFVVSVAKKVKEVSNVVTGSG